MSQPADRPRSRAAATGGLLRRAGASLRALEPEQRTAGAGATALFVTMFLPWYSNSTVGVNPKGMPVKVEDSVTAFGVFSFVEAAVLLVAAGILWMLFARGEGKAFHLPFGDGNVIFGAGLWVCLLVFYRQFDKPTPETGEGLQTTVGVSWGIFVTFLVGLFIAFSGQRLRSARLAEPPLPGDVGSSDGPLPRGRRRPVDERSDPERGTERTVRDSGSVRGDSDPRPRPSRDVFPTVVDRRGPTVDETLVADVPEFPRAPGASSPVKEPPAADPPTGPTRVRREGPDQLRLDDWDELA